MKGILERLYNGIIKENPTFVLMLGMCPTLAVTTSALNGLGMGVATMAVLIMSNMIISLLRKVIPNGVRVPVYIIIIASFVTIVEMLMHAFLTPLYSSLGIFIPLIVVNCIIFAAIYLPSFSADGHCAQLPVQPVFFFSFLLTPSLFIKTQRSESTKNAPGARMKIEIGS